jgi:hypothetical protein
MCTRGRPTNWIVDPDARTVEALRLDNDDPDVVRDWRVRHVAVARIAPFDAVELE